MASSQESQGTQENRCGVSEQAKLDAARLEQQIRATTRELRMRLDYLDQLAQQQNAELETLRAQPPSPQRNQAISRIEQKMGFYQMIKAASEGFEDAQTRQPASLAAGRADTSPLRVTNQDLTNMRLIEAQSILASARLAVDDMAPRMRMLAGALGKPGRYAPPELAQLNRLKERLKTQAQLVPRLQLALQTYDELAAALPQLSKQVDEVRRMAGRDALQQLQTMRTPAIAGKLYQLERLPAEVAGDPEFSKLFPEPQPIRLPLPSRTPTGQLQAPEAKPAKKGGFLGLFGLGPR
ncbi:MAG: hypothetical protein FJY99_07770 [Candidatus Sericytochromatia bacterium]|nr:hypothetical protein [Candidatus Tanganyikabacteria bacterium]